MDGTPSKKREPASQGETHPLPESSNSSWRVEDDLGSIQTVHEPVERVMPPVADIHCYFSELCLEHCVASVSLHIICRLRVEQTQQVTSFKTTMWDSVAPNTPTSLKSPILGIWFFRLFPNTFPELEITTAVFHRVLCSSSRSRIGDTTTMLYFLASWWQSDSVAVFCRSAHRHTASHSQRSHLLAETGGVSFFSRLCKLRPWVFLTGAESKRHRYGEQESKREPGVFFFTLVKCLHKSLHVSTFGWMLIQHL